jgi:very-short-patch-repair endonuclease/predicted transcriptional regulator of viral defense system
VSACALCPEALGCVPFVLRVRACRGGWGRVSECGPASMTFELVWRRRASLAGSCTVWMTRALWIGVESVFSGVDRSALELARRQHGVITHAQLLEVGLSRDGIRHRVASGWLLRLHRGIYLVGAVEPPLARAIAAVLALGDSALLSHYPAAVLWGLRPPPAREMHVTVIARNVSGPKGIQVHKMEVLHPSDARSRHGIPTTSPARTLLDLATQAPQRDLDRAVNQARVTKLVSDTSLNEQFIRYPHHRGTAALRRALQLEPAFTRSKGERLLLALVRKARLPNPVTNTELHGYEADHHWRDHKLIVEVDGYDVHSTRAAFEADRRRDAELQARGYRVLRVTWRQLTEEPEAVLANLSAALARP